MPDISKVSSLFALLFALTAAILAAEPAAVPAVLRAAGVPAPAIGQLREQAGAMAYAVVHAEHEKLVEFMPADLIRILGGREAVSAGLRQGADTMKQQGYRYRLVRFPEDATVLATGKTI